LNGAVSKTVVGSWSTEGSNPSPSALHRRIAPGADESEPSPKLLHPAPHMVRRRQETSVCDARCAQCVPKTTLFRERRTRRY
jgi:hypothetical protein